MKDLNKSLAGHEDKDIMLKANARGVIPIESVVFDEDNDSIVLKPGLPVTTDEHIKEMAERFFSEFVDEQHLVPDPSFKEFSSDMGDLLTDLIIDEQKGEVDWNKPTLADYLQFNKEFFLGGGFTREQFNEAVAKNVHTLHLARENGWDDSEVRDDFSEILKTMLAVDSLEDYVINNQQ